ncbi:DUF6059 family protein [Streptomyces glaucescens]|uniref:Uncharacterized protein n=1 Tax=Streptomyces glaucescens TaxID=1907 RepID=A0A089XIE1_STRGA|nr:DUF6059 family protein [Streptomyces glaucescens]AIS01737.1 hypothetical protein SGLAU_29015 [Streptomyces glaucescens]
MRKPLRGLLRFLMDALIAYGEVYMCPPPPELAGPAPGHPEQLRPDVPLTETEHALARQLTGDRRPEEHRRGGRRG